MIDRSRIFQSNKKNKGRNLNEMPEEQRTTPKDNHQELRQRKRNLTKKTSVEKLKKMNKNENNNTSEMHKNKHDNNNIENQNENNETIVQRYSIIENYYKDKKGTKKKGKKVSIAVNKPQSPQSQNMEQNEYSNKPNDRDSKPYSNFADNLKTNMRESSMEKERENPDNEDSNNPKKKGNKKNIYNFDKFVNKDTPNFPKSSKNGNRFLENEENNDNTCNNINGNIEIERLRKELELKDNKINELLKTIESLKNQIIQSNNNYSSLYEENKQLRLEINNLKSMINQNQYNQSQNVLPQNVQPQNAPSQNTQSNGNKSNHLLNIIKNKISDTRMNQNEEKPQNENENNIIINKEKTIQIITNLTTINKNSVDNTEMKKDKNLNNLLPITNFKPIINSPISNNDNPSINNIAPVSNPVNPPPQDKPEEKKDRKHARASQAFERFKRANRNLITTALKADKSGKISDIAKQLETHFERRPRRENSVAVCERIDEGIERILGDDNENENNNNKNGAFNNEIVNIIDNQPVVQKKKKKVRSFSYDD